MRYRLNYILLSILDRIDTLQQVTAVTLPQAMLLVIAQGMITRSLLNTISLIQNHWLAVTTTNFCRQRGTGVPQSCAWRTLVAPRAHVFALSALLFTCLTSTRASVLVFLETGAP
eukprot:3205329-Amphidinium_carterae.2